MLVGPSGCGKTTVLRMIAGLEGADAGRLFIDGADVEGVMPKDRNIAMVFQNYALYPHMDAYKNMEFGLKMRKVPKQDRHDKIMKTAGLLQIKGLLERKPAQMSGGERQRVALGRAMVRNPEAFLLDEPLSNLDAALRTEMRYNIMKLHKKLKATFVYVTHDQTEAMTMADRIVVMNRGRIEQEGSPEDIYKYPANLFVAGFIGTPMMNLIQTTLKSEGSRYYIEIGEGRYMIPENRFQTDALQDYSGKEVICGFRAEDVLTGGQEKERGAIELVEKAGPETFIHVDVGGFILISRRAGLPAVSAGSETSVGFNMEALHIFDHVTEIALPIEKY